MDLTNLHWVGAVEGARMIRDGVITSVELVQACLACVREVDGQIQAWAFLDPEHALAQARAADEYRMSGQPTGALHGVPVGIKDIIDTADMPTENGSVLHAGRTPSLDASVVSLLLGGLAAHDERDPDSRPRARVPYRDVAAQEPPLTPMFAFLKTPLWDRVDPDAREAFEELVDHLGGRVEEIELVVSIDEVLE